MKPTKFGVDYRRHQERAEQFAQEGDLLGLQTGY